MDPDPPFPGWRDLAGRFLACPTPSHTRIDQPTQRLLLLDFNLGSDHDAEVQGQRCHADRRASMLAHLIAVQIDDQLGKPIDHIRRLPKARFGVDHPMNHQPRGHPVKIAQGSLQTSQHRQRGAAGGLLRLLQRDLGRHLAEGTSG
jgi:hypothetical protein